MTRGRLSRLAARDMMARVADAVVEASATYVEPLFKALTDSDVSSKAPGELVTRADAACELFLTETLGSVLPAPVVGEEACSERPGLMAALEGSAAWLVDPLDGTANFVAGSDDWAVMVALVVDGWTVASWIWRAVPRRLYLAEAGAGATCNGLALHRAGAPRDAAKLRGLVLTRFLDPGDAALAQANAAGFASVVAGSGSAGADYPLLAEGAQDFVLYGRALPWDHAPGALLAEEAGCVVLHRDGRRYKPEPYGTAAGGPGPYERVAPGKGLLAAADGGTWSLVNGGLFASSAQGQLA